MKKLILLAFVLLPVLLSGQVLKGTGISYFDSIPNVAPSLPKGTEIALGIKTKKLYRWDRTCSCWIELETSTDSLARTVLASGLFNEYAVPFGGSTGKLDQSAAFKFILGQLQANSFATLGSAGAGYVGLSPQSSVPATPASGIRVYADASGRFGWIGTNGYTRVFDASGITANRIFKLQNKTYTLADSADVASLSASLPGAYFPLLGGAITGTGGAGFVGFPAQSSNPSTPAGGFRLFANGAGNMAVIRADGYVTTFDFSAATGNRFFTYPANAGTFGILENAQTWSGATNTFLNSNIVLANGTSSQNLTLSNSSGTLVLSQAGGVAGFTLQGNSNTIDLGTSGLPEYKLRGVNALKYINSTNLMVGGGFGYTYVQPTGTGGPGFEIVTTAKFAINAPKMTDAQVAALTGQVSGGWVYSTTQQRPFVHNGTDFQGVVLGPQSGFASNQIAYGGAGGNLIASPSLTFSGSSLSINVSDGTMNVGNNGYPVFYFKGINALAHTANGGGGTLAVGLGYGTVIMTNLSITSTGITASNGLRLTPAYSSTGDLSGGGYGFRMNTATYTNTTTAASGTVANSSLASLDGGAIASTNTGVTYTNAATLRISAAPTAGTNSTITNAWGLQIASGVSSYIPRTVFGSAFSNQGGVMATINPLNSAFYGTISTSGNYAAAAFQAQNTGTGVVAGVIGNVTSNASSAGTFYGIIGEAMGQANLTGGAMIGVLGYFRSGASGVTNNVTGNAFSARIELNSNAGAGGLPNSFVGGYVIETVSRNNSGATTLAGFYSAGIGNPSGLANTIANYNPLALNSGSLTNVTNTWSYIDHRLVIGGVSNPNAAVLLDLVSTTRGLLIPRATNAQIAAVSSPPVGLQMISTDDERIHLKRTSGFFQIAYTQDIKRDTSYQITNTNLDISGQTANFKNRYHTVRIATAVTAAATANNVITMPVPHADLLGINFKVSVVDVSGDSDISQLSFGTDGVDGYLSNGDGTYAPTQNLYPGLGVYVSVAWDQNKSAYRWFLQ